jgi:hypothetical protein
MIKRFRRRRAERTERRIAELERRIEHLENQLEGLQDAVYRESVRHDAEIHDLAKSTQPRSLTRALSEDARRRGI